MKYLLYLRCTKCGKESDQKEYDCSENRINQIMEIGRRALKMVQHIMCPNCGSLFSVKLTKEQVK